MIHLKFLGKTRKTQNHHKERIEVKDEINERLKEQYTRSMKQIIGSL